MPEFTELPQSQKRASTLPREREKVLDNEMCLQLKYRDLDHRDVREHFILGHVLGIVFAHL